MAAILQATRWWANLSIVLVCCAGLLPNMSSLRASEIERTSSSEPVERESHEQGDLAEKPTWARENSDRSILRLQLACEKREQNTHRGQIRQHFTGEHQAVVDCGHDYRNGLGAPLLC